MSFPQNNPPAIPVAQGDDDGRITTTAGPGLEYGLEQMKLNDEEPLSTEEGAQDDEWPAPDPTIGQIQRQRW
jgi:hypothetical protein